MAQRELVVAKDVLNEGWEKATFPLVCETCLGDNPYVRMIRSVGGRECKICCRPYTSFRWQPGRRARYKTTITCQTCARVKNVCQVCLFDLDYGLPVQVRDKFLDASQVVNLPESRVNRDYALNKIRESGILPVSHTATESQVLLRLARTQPYYQRNQARICSFWQRGECTRGDSCPYRHETDSQHDPILAQQNIRDRYMGRNDPVANKILKTLQEETEAEENKESAELETNAAHKAAVESYKELQENQ